MSLSGASTLALQILKAMKIPNLPTNCVSCTYELVVVLIHQHLHITVQIFYLSCHFHMALQQAIHRCLAKLCVQNQCGIESRLQDQNGEEKKPTESKCKRSAPCRKLTELHYLQSYHSTTLHNSPNSLNAPHP